jgi:hypothetical protein
VDFGQFLDGGSLRDWPPKRAAEVPVENELFIRTPNLPPPTNPPSNSIQIPSYFPRVMFPFFFSIHLPHHFPKFIWQF